MHKIADKLTQVHNRIQHSAQTCGRNPDTITLLAVSKKHSAEAIREAYNCGQRDFGENYLQESLDKMIQLKDLSIDWHFIGPIQSNKTRAIAENFSWVHSVDRLKIARRLNEQRPTEQSPLSICLQVNIDGEESKSGLAPEQVLSAAREVLTLKHLKLRGLMAIPKAGSTEAFQALARCYQELLSTNEFPSLDTLSMGMSADLEDAIASGSTVVRIGTDIFGQRS